MRSLSITFVAIRYLLCFDWPSFHDVARDLSHDGRSIEENVMPAASFALRARESSSWARGVLRTSKLSLANRNASSESPPTVSQKSAA